MLEQSVKAIIEFTQANQHMLLPVIFVIAFLECLAFMSILAPATLLFTAFAAMAGASGLSLFPIALTSTVGSVMGYWVSYLIGLYLGPRVLERWPLNKRPDLVEKVHRFFEKWGAFGILISHFWGQVRPLAPLVAGIVRMPAVPFHIANFIGSLGWSFGIFYGAGQIGSWMR